MPSLSRCGLKFRPVFFFWGNLQYAFQVLLGIILFPRLCYAVIMSLFYCRVRTSVIEVEYPLIETQLQELDTVLEKAISELNWTSDG